MINTMGWLLIGAAVAGVSIGFAHRLRWHSQVRCFAVLLFLAGAIYLLLGAFHAVRWIAIESAGAVLFSLLACAGVRWPLVLGLGWVLHAGWDAGLHLAIEQPVIGPWYLLMCLAFDPIVAGYLAYAYVRRRRPL